VNVLDRLDELEREATTGPWDNAGWHVHAGSRFTPTHQPLASTHGDSEADAALIALSRNHLRALIEVARAAQYVRDAWLIIEADDAHLMNACARLDPALAPLLEEGGER